MTIRALTAADRAALAGFTCARLGEAWAETMQETIRHDLADQIAAGIALAVGLFDQGGALCGVAAWRIYDVMPPVLCRSDIVAVAVRERRKGYGLALKQAVIDKAKAAGAVAAASIVHRHNSAMLALNRRRGATVEDDPEEKIRTLAVETAQLVAIRVGEARGMRSVVDDIVSAPWGLRCWTASNTTPAGGGTRTGSSRSPRWPTRWTPTCGRPQPGWRMRRSSRSNGW